jgi:hypothetical protein
MFHGIESWDADVDVQVWEEVDATVVYSSGYAGA